MVILKTPSLLHIILGSMESLPLSVFVIDTKSIGRAVVVYANRQSSELFGYDAPEIIGLKGDLLLPSIYNKITEETEGPVTSSSDRRERLVVRSKSGEQVETQKAGQGSRHKEEGSDSQGVGLPSLVFSHLPRCVHTLTRGVRVAGSTPQVSPLSG